MLLARGLLAVLLVHCVAHALQQHGNYPTIHLRTRSISTQELVERQQRRRLQGLPPVAPPTHRHHTFCAEWGALQQAQQLLLTHRPGLQHTQQEALVAAVEEAGASVAGYLPDHTVLLVGSHDVADALADHPDVLWLGVHDEQDKLAPEWSGILQQLGAATPQLERVAALAAEQRQRQQPWANATQAVAAAVGTLRASLPVMTRWYSGTGQLLVGAVVHFPGLVTPRQLSTGSSGGNKTQQFRQHRVRRIMLQRKQQDPGAAAAADWAPLLASRFGARLERGSADTAVVLAPAQRLAAVLEWLAHRPAVHWVAPAPRLRLANKRVTTISQGAIPPSETASLLDPTYHPLWAAGLTGANQVVGCGDSGLDIYHCFFTDPTLDWNNYVSIQDGYKTFDSATHRKIRYYRAFGDTEDSNGHGTHVVGTLVGMPYGATLAENTDATRYAGMAPDAKVAFIDLADGSSDNIYTPTDLINGYFKYTTAVGALVHSDSWGSDSIYYDNLAAMVDQYSWDNPTFLPVIAAGNDGDKATGVGKSGEVTVTSPANAKNCLSVGATQTYAESMESTAETYKVWDATLVQGEYDYSFRVMQAKFGPDVSVLVGEDGQAPPQFQLAVASPADGCAPLSGTGLSGAIVLIQRGTCKFGDKALAAQAAGAAGVLIYDNVLGAYFPYSAEESVAQSVQIPVMSVTRRIGQTLVSAVSTGKAVTIFFAPSTIPAYSFENLASYSSQGPTPDYRVKPDVVAPGTITSAKVDYSSPTDCGTTTYAGTSMATPVVAGAAVLLRQYFMDGFYPSGVATPDAAFTPTGSLLKAVMLGGAATITGFEADTGLPVDPPPSFRQGFGRVWLANSVYLANRENSPQLQVLDAVPINQDETHNYCVRANGGPLSITLVWADYPGQPTASKALVNDLDLSVRAAGLNGIPLLGNGGSVSDPNTPDRENNVEQVSLTSLPAGAVAISVRGHAIFGAAGVPQYALVVNGDFNGTLVKPDEAGGAEQCTIVVANITSGPVGITSADPIVFEFGTQSSATGITFECRLGDAAGNITDPAAHHDWRVCTSPVQYSGLPDGSYQFAVRAQGEDIASTQNFVKDTVPPAVTFIRAGGPTSTFQLGSPAAPTSTSEATAVFEFSGSDSSGVNFTCTLSASGTVAAQPPVYAGASRMSTLPVSLGQPFNCTSPLPFRWLLPASWKVQVVGVDGAGNAAAPQEATWAVAFAAGQLYTRFTDGPYGLQPKGNMAFTFAAFDSAGATAAASNGFECWLESLAGGATPIYAPCTSPHSLPADIQDGDYRFHVRLAGVAPADGSDAVSSLTIDSVAPNVTIVEAPQAIHQGSAAPVQFTATEEGSSFFCSTSRTDPGTPPPVAPTDPAAYTPCTSPVSLGNLTDGTYAFAVYAVDAVGNQGSPSTATFIVDTTPPTIDAQVPHATSQPTITATFTATDLGSGVLNVTCRFRGLTMVSGGGAVSNETSNWTPCTSPVTYSDLKEGRYGLTFTATDNAGLSNQTREYDVFVDFTPPTVSTAKFPAIGTPQPSTVTFHLSELSKLPADSYSNVTVFQTLVQSIPNATDFAALQAAWHAESGSGGAGDSTAGSTMAAGSRSGWAGRRRLLGDGTSDSGGEQETVLPASAVGQWTNCTAVCTYEDLDTGMYSLQVRGVDAAGNVGNASAPYPFQVDASLNKSSGLPLWGIIAIAVGGAVVLALAAWLTWHCCCTTRSGRRPGNSAAGPATPSGAISAGSVYTYSPSGYSQSGAYSNGAAYSSGYTPGGYPTPTSSANGAWGYTNGHANGHHHGSSPVAASFIEQQRMALAQAQAASQRSRQPRQQQWHAPAAASAAAAALEREEAQLRAAMEESLREQHSRRKEDDDAQLQAAIQASLREQQQHQSWGRP